MQFDTFILTKQLGNSSWANCRVTRADARRASHVFSICSMVDFQAVGGFGEVCAAAAKRGTGSLGKSPTVPVLPSSSMLEGKVALNQRIARLVQSSQIAMGCGCISRSSQALC